MLSLSLSRFRSFLFFLFHPTLLYLIFIPPPFFILPPPSASLPPSLSLILPSSLILPP